MAESLNDIIARTPTGGVAALPAGEFEGPVRIDRAMTLRGSNTTVWAKHGSVIEITSPGVSIEGLRVEITEGALTETAISASCAAAARNVEVLGTVSGFGTEDGESEIPRTLSLGELSADEDNTFRMTVDIPAAARLVCPVSGVKFQPENVPAGRSEVTLTVTGSGSPALIYTEVLLESQFRRRIYLTGRFSVNAPAVHDRVIFEAGQVERKQPAQPFEPVQPEQAVPMAQQAFSIPMSVTTARSTPTDVISNVGAAPLPDDELIHLKKGQRVPLRQYTDALLEIGLSGIKKGDVDIDPYIFMLDENERSLGDGGFVFFGNTASPDGAVRYYPDDGHVSVKLSAVDDNVKRIAVVFSVYSGDSRRNFSLVSEPRMSIYAQGRERIRFDLDGLSGEVTVVAAEFYIYKGEWRISAVGSGYRDGLAKLCNRYGIEVSG
ncbi:MAG: TerD family protein [Oscillospiraceae bacterium]